MQLDLSAEEAAVLVDALEKALGDLREEIYKSEVAEYKAALKQREAILKKVANPQLFTLLSMQECEVFFEVKSRTLYRWVQEGKLKAGAKRGSITIKSIREMQARKSRKSRKPQV